MVEQIGIHLQGPPLQTWTVEWVPLWSYTATRQPLVFIRQDDSF